MEIPAEYTQRIRILPNGCWLWLGTVVGLRNKTGSLPYGIVAREGKRLRVHRYFYELATGQHPGKEHVHHRCQNTLCVNPDHLEALPQGQHNHVHGIFQQQAEAARESPACRHGHPWSQYAYVWKGIRYCKGCQADAQRRRRKARGAGTKGMGYNQRLKTHCPQGHPYSGDNLKLDPDGHRQCRTCRRAYIRGLRARKKARLSITE